MSVGANAVDGGGVSGCVAAAYLATSMRSGSSHGIPDMRTMVLGLPRIGVIGMKRIGLMVLVVAVLVLSACTTEVLTLDVGTCFDDPEAFDLVDSSDVPIVECDVPHDNEVYANRDL
jgi:hypothetical protein